MNGKSLDTTNRIYTNEYGVINCGDRVTGRPHCRPPLQPRGRRLSLRANTETNSEHSLPGGQPSDVWPIIVSMFVRRSKKV